MAHEIVAFLKTLSDDDLLAGIRGLVHKERLATARLVAHLAEADERGLVVARGYGSLHAYCTRALGLTDQEAYLRIQAARAGREFPLVLERLLSADITLTAAALLRQHLSAENHRAVLDDARGKTRTEVEELGARLRPRPDVPASVRKLPLPETRRAAEAPPPLPTKEPTESRPVPLAPDRYRYQLTIDGETRDLLSFARDLLRHVHPDGDDAALLKRALGLLVDDVVRKRFAVVDRPGSAGRARNDSRHIPSEVKRAVFIRDRGRCAYVGTHGHRCNERAFLEFHHVTPYAAGGAATVENCQLRCRRHNQYEGRLYFARDAHGAPRLETPPATQARLPVP